MKIVLPLPSRGEGAGEGDFLWRSVNAIQEEKNMKTKVLGVAIGLLLLGSNVFGADGDLIVNGYLGVGTTDPVQRLQWGRRFTSTRKTTGSGSGNRTRRGPSLSKEPRREGGQPLEHPDHRLQRP